MKIYELSIVVRDTDGPPRRESVTCDAQYAQTWLMTMAEELALGAPAEPREPGWSAEGYYKPACGSPENPLP